MIKTVPEGIIDKNIVPAGIFKNTFMLFSINRGLQALVLRVKNLNRPAGTNHKENVPAGTNHTQTCACKHL